MLILEVKKETCLSPGLSYLLADTFSTAPHTVFGAHKKDEPFTAAHFLTIKALQRKKRKAQARESYPHEYLPAFFPSLYPPVDSLSDSCKTHPSLASIRLSLNWLEITLMTLSNKPRASHI